MDPRKNARRGYAQRESRRRQAMLWQPEIFTPKEGKKMTNITRNIVFALCAVVLVLIVGCALVGPAVFNRTIMAQPEIGSQPLVNNAEPQIYASPMASGQMTTDGYITYVQSGKPNERRVSGHVAEGQVLVCTAYRTLFRGELLDNGVVMTITGPLSLDENPINLVDGACTLVSASATQAKLDSMWIDFCRGDKKADGTWWSYQPWALSHVSVGNFYFPTSTASCFTEAEDTFPSFLSRPAQAPAPSADNRTTTGVGLSLPFKAGTPVLGYKIVLNDGTVYNQCFLANPSVDGIVTDGVIYPWPTEVTNTPACK